MSHTVSVSTDEYGQVFASFNSDLSGDATIQWEDGGNGKRNYVTIPAQILLAVSAHVIRRQIKNEIIDFIEGLD